MNDHHNNTSRGSNNNGGPNANAAPITAAAAYLPRYLSQLVRHYHDDFYISRSFETQLIVQLMAEGFLPIAAKGYLLPKLHVERSVLQLQPQSKLHISKSTRKKSKSFLISVNECFDEVVAGCHRQQ
jgi:Leu/Phe-tRNA-protein transferase